MANHGSEHSSALLAAQQKLLQLRKQRQAERIALDLPNPSKRADLTFSRPEHPLTQTFIAANTSLPHHIGWESAPLAAALRATQNRRSSIEPGAEVLDQSYPGLCPPNPSSQTTPTQPQPEISVKLHPDIALGMLRQEAAAAGRIWLLLRTIDVTGRGCISIKDARQHLTENTSSLRVCGWRQLRNLLSQGENQYWTRSSDRLWLRSVAKVAASLDVRRLTGSPVAIPVSILTQGMGAVRAHLYASFHSGRTTRTSSGKQNSMPIARETIRKLTCVSRRTQRQYETRTKIRRRRNFAVGSGSQSVSEQETAWQHGRAVFHLTDRKGKQGPAGNSYLAWQLPNSYFGPHDHRPRGRQKRINQELADLFTQGMTGNGGERVGDEHRSDQFDRRKRFYGDGRLAAKAYNQPNCSDVYWCHKQASNGRRDSSFWFHLPGKQGSNSCIE